MNELVKFDEVAAAIAQYKAENESLVFNYEDPQGNKDARSHIYKLRQVKTKIADIHKVAKAEALGVCRLLDGKKKELTGEVDGMIDVHYKPVKEIEEREAKKAAEKANAERLESIRIEAERVAETERREKELAEKEAAVQAEQDRLAREAEKLEAAKQAEIDKQTAVKAAQEQAERDRVAATAQAEQDKKDALAAAEAEKQAAVEAEQEKARQVDVARIKKVAAEKAAEAIRVADEDHRRQTETAAHKAIWELLDEIKVDPHGLLNTQIAAVKIRDAIKNGKIPHVTINY